MLSITSCDRLYVVSMTLTMVSSTGNMGGKLLLFFSYDLRSNYPLPVTSYQLPVKPNAAHSHVFPGNWKPVTGNSCMGGLLFPSTKQPYVYIHRIQSHASILPLDIPLCFAGLFYL